MAVTETEATNQGNKVSVKAANKDSNFFLKIIALSANTMSVGCLQFFCRILIRFRLLVIRIRLVESLSRSALLNEPRNVFDGGSQ